MVALTGVEPGNRRSRPTPRFGWTWRPRRDAGFGHHQVRDHQMPLSTRRALRSIFRNIVHDLAVATTSRTDRSALTRPLHECGEETCLPIGTCPAPITSERDQEAA